jgi:hypothetical protein
MFILQWRIGLLLPWHATNLVSFSANHDDMWMRFDHLGVAERMVPVMMSGEHLSQSDATGGHFSKDLVNTLRRVDDAAM